MDDNLEFACENSFENSPKMDIPLGIKSVFDLGDLGPERALAGISEVDDFGRESLGIIDINHPDFGRESLSFLLNPRNEDFGRESLGIINLNDLDIGGESLAITGLKTMPHINLTEVTVTELNENESNSPLNTAFLMPSRASVSTSISSLNSINPSFNSASLDSSIPSRIFSSVSSYKSDIMNDAFIDTSNFIKHLQLFGKSSLSSIYSALDKKLECLNKPHRLQSLPSTLECQMNSHTSHGQDVTSKINHEVESKKCWSSDKPKEKKMRKRAFSETLSFVICDNEFNDSVFFEANHLAWRIENGSILDLDECENDMLDSIQKPEDFMIEVSENDELAKHDTKTVFKTVDKMLPPTPVHRNVSKNQSAYVQDNLNSSSRISFKYDESNCSSNNRSNDSKSKDPRDILNTLSEILSNDHPTEQQKSEGQNLLTSLAEILISSGSTKSNSLDDSGHSSIESEPVMSQINECYEVLDLRKKSSSETSVNQMDSYENCVPLDLSLKSKSGNSEKVFVSPKILPPKFNNSQQKFLIKKNKSIESNCSGSSNDSKNMTDFKNKFRPKKTEEKLLNPRKGPMKAVIPLDNMARRKSGVIKLQITPTRIEPQSSNFKLKKISTPINEPNLKPMAQSTPDGLSSSPVSRPNTSKLMSPKTVKQKLNYSESNILSNKSQDLGLTSSFLRRRSVSDMKKIQGNEKTLTRSYSAGEKSGLAPTLSKVRQSIAKSATTVKRNYRLGIENSTSVLKENRNKTLTKPHLAKRSGKENAC